MSNINGTVLKSNASGKEESYIVLKIDDYEYTDIVDKSVSKNQV